MSSYRDLRVWQEAIELTDEVYAAVRHFPREEMFVLSQQMRSAAVSIASNIAEGKGRSTNAEFRHFLRIARGSTLELQTQIVIAHRQRFIDDERTTVLDQKAEAVGCLLNGLLRKLG